MTICINQTPRQNQQFDGGTAKHECRLPSQAIETLQMDNFEATQVAYHVLLHFKD
jgi:hypothetical protein